MEFWGNRTREGTDSRVCWGTMIQSPTDGRLAMRKTFWITAVLLASLGLAVGQTAQAPRIVAKGKFIGRKGNLTQTIFTPTQAGIYRVSTYFVLTTPDLASKAEWAVFESWMDDAGQEFGGLIVVLDAGSFGSSSVVIDAVAGTPTRIQTVHSDQSHTTVYSLYYVVESVVLLP